MGARSQGFDTFESSETAKVPVPALGLTVTPGAGSLLPNQSHVAVVAFQKYHSRFVPLP